MLKSKTEIMACNRQVSRFETLEKILDIAGEQAIAVTSTTPPANANI
ncbi:MAG TPA: hypothetical protein VM640_05820 [Desulfitobacterium sp.]|nr:hypothetical protein [Desulfitobacterium sp.]HVJ48643.1 hypothetical protein [Desulfitobacterium sp.]